MSANFTPELTGYSGIQPFRFWCQKVMPLTYDDSLSYYELLCKVVDYLNNAISDLATAEDNIGALAGAYDQLQDYVNDKLEELETYMNNYFNNLDVQDEIDHKLDAMAASGALSTLIAPLIPSLVTDWLTENVTPVGGAVVVDESLTISGAAADAKVTGDNFTAVESDISDISTSNKNLWTGNSSYTFVKTQTVALDPAIPAGTYVLSAVCTSTDTDTTKCRFQINNSTITKDLTRVDRASQWFYTPNPITSITFYAAAGGSASTGDTATWSDIQIEKGQYATPYVAHKLIGLDQVARDELSRIVKYVSTSGNDNNSGDTTDYSYATIGKAISERADVIYIAHGTYTEDSIPENTWYRNRGVKIYADRAILKTQYGIEFRLADVEIHGLTIDLSDYTGDSRNAFMLLNSKALLVDCVAIGATSAGGFRFDGTQSTCIRCVAHDNSVDGFNGHKTGSPQSYESEVTLIDCIAYNNGDDGASIHESGKMFVRGGEYYSNTQTGLAPHDNVYFEISNAYCHDNGKGIEAVNDSTGTGYGQVIGCIMEDNSTYGLDVKNFSVNTLANGYLGNGTAKTHAGTGATITTFSAE